MSETSPRAPKSSKCDECIDICASTHVKYDRNGQIKPPRGSFCSSWRGLGHRGILGNLYFQNGRFASTGARFSKPVRARTGSELQRERILSLGIKRELGRESEKTRREAKERITTRYLIPSYTRAWWHDSKTASRLESPRA